MIDELTSEHKREIKESVQRKYAKAGIRRRRTARAATSCGSKTSARQAQQTERERSEGASP